MRIGSDILLIFTHLLSDKKLIIKMILLQDGKNKDALNLCC